MNGNIKLLRVIISSIYYKYLIDSNIFESFNLGFLLLFLYDAIWMCYATTFLGIEHDLLCFSF